MAMANLLLTPSLTIIAQKPSEQPPSSFKRSFSYTPTTSWQPLPLSLLLSSKHAAKPISPVLKKEPKGFGVDMNTSAFWALSVWDDVMQTVWGNVMETDKKFLYPLAAKEDTIVAETKDDTWLAKIKVHITTKRKRPGGKPSRKTYMVIVGASFCTVVLISPFVLPKQIISRCIVVPELLIRSMKNFSFDDLFGCPLTWELLSSSMKMFMYVMSELPSLIYLFLWWYDLIFNRNIGKMRKRKLNKKQSTTFDDVEGVDAAKAELLEIVLCIKGDSKYIKLGAKLPRGVLLAGPPGTGKTLLARAVAGEADVAFFSISASEFVEVYVGAGAARVRDVFRNARKRSPSIIFIDEIDAVGGQRGTTSDSERDQTLNQLLTEMDGFEKGAKVVVIAATKRPESLDSALIRPGRYSRKVIVGVPNEDGRRKIFGLYLKKVPMEEDKQVICDLVASRTPGLVGADLENIAHESVLLAARRGGDFVTKEDVLQAVKRATTKIYNDDLFKLIMYRIRSRWLI